MTSQPIRDQVEDHLLTPKNFALIIIDYQPVQVASVASMDRRTLVSNITVVTKAAQIRVACHPFNSERQDRFEWTYDSSVNGCIERGRAA